MLSAEILNGTPVEDAALRKLLLGEVREILRQTLPKFGEGDVYSPKNCIIMLYREHSIDKSILDDGILEIAIKRWNNLSSFAIQLIGMSIEPMILPQALASPTFLKFDIQSSAFVETPEYKQLQQLHEQIALFNKRNEDNVTDIVFENTPNQIGRNAKHVTLDVRRFMSLLSSMQRWSNVIDLSKSVIHYLEKGSLLDISLFKRSPLLDMNDGLEAEIPTDHDIDAFVFGAGPEAKGSSDA